MWPEIVSIGAALLSLGLHLHSKRVPKYRVVPKAAAEPEISPASWVPIMKRHQTGLFSHVDIVIGWKDNDR